jgi:hypothetical protein
MTAHDLVAELNRAFYYELTESQSRYAYVLFYRAIKNGELELKSIEWATPTAVIKPAHGKYNAMIKGSKVVIARLFNTEFGVTLTECLHDLKMVQNYLGINEKVVQNGKEFLITKYGA